jgi:hypothetical protein
LLRPTFAFALSLVAVPAFASDKTCSSLAKLRKELAPGVVMSALTLGQFNFLRGFYMGVPPTLQGKIPGTGAFLFEHQGDKGGVIVWTLGPLACQPTPVPPAFIATMKASATGILDADGNEL